MLPPLHAADLPPQTRPWPDELEPPPPLCVRPDVALEDGLYALYRRDGSVSFLGSVARGQLQRWLTLTGEEACLDLGMAAQKFYSSGHTEIFQAFGEKEPRLPAEVPYEVWLQGQVRLVAGLPLAQLPEDPDQPALFGHMPPLRKLLEELKAWPGDLNYGTQLKSFLESRYHLGERDSGWTAEFLAAAFYCAIVPRAPTCFLEPDWEGTFGCRETSLDSVELFREARKLVWRDLRLARCYSIPKGGMSIVASGPPDVRDTCPLRALQVLCELHLRQDPSRPKLDLPSASLAGAYLLAPELNVPLDFMSSVQPWRSHPDELPSFRQVLHKVRADVNAGRKLPDGLASFFITRRQAIGLHFTQFATGRWGFPRCDFPPWSTPSPRPIRREDWRDRAEESMRILPDAPVGKVERSRLQNRLASLGTFFTRGQDEVPRRPELEAYLARWKEPGPEVRRALIDLLGTDELGGELLSWVNGVLWVLEGFYPDPRKDRSRVIQAGKIARFLLTRITS